MLNNIEMSGGEIKEHAVDLKMRMPSFFDNLEISEKTDIHKTNLFDNLNNMKEVLGETYKEIKADKPKNSPNIGKWFENGGKIEISEIDGKTTWTYIDKVKKAVKYVEGYPIFPSEAKHPYIDDINIGEFTGDRNKDKELYLDELEDMYGLTEIPDGYALHHDTMDGNLQLIDESYHKEFTHAGGHSMFK